MSKILIIDDEVQIRRLLRMILETKNFSVVEASTGEEALQLAAFQQPDAILLDMGLPDRDGLEVLRRLRDWTDVPVLVLSVRDQEEIKIAALENGADDYVTKPFGTGELLARLAAIQRRRFTRQSPEVEAGPLVLNLLHHEVWLNRELVKLTPIEFSLLKMLAENFGRIVTQNQILLKVWPGQTAGASEALRVHIAKLRKKLGKGPPSILNEPGIGYRLIGTATAEEGDPALEE